MVRFLTASFGRLIGDVGMPGNVLVAAIFILVGLYLMDLLPISWSGFGLHPEKSKGWSGAFLLGLIFGVSLGPCTFAYMAPVLGLVISLAANSWLKPILLVFAFGIGHCTVIVGAGTLTRTVQKYLRWTSESKTTTYLKRGAGALVLFGGAYFIFTTF
ncbi:hypothetical protein B1H10_06875 [candidate division KSB1 bacterium 4484_188]|nr:MAG: hypothetical protein B1H10_06875 [candidate division KSB1 bacterium 4484_188]